MDASAVGAARLAGERLPGGTGFLAGVPAALAVGVTHFRQAASLAAHHAAIAALTSSESSPGDTPGASEAPIKTPSGLT
jgi:hypothetical protein